MFKHKENMIDVFLVHSLLNQVMYDMQSYCDEKAIPFTVTEILTSKEIDKKYSRKSSSHRTGRAFDLSVRGWRNDHLSRFLDHFNTKYKDIAAVNSHGIPRFAVYHDNGNGKHIHIQIHMKYKRWELNTSAALNEMRINKAAEIFGSVSSFDKTFNETP